MLSGWHRVTNRLSLVVILLCVAVVAGLWLATLQRIRFEHKQAVDVAMHANSNLAIAFEQQVNSTLKAAEQLASIVRQQFIATDGNTRLDVWDEVGVIREPLFNIVSVVDENGLVIDSTREALGVDYSDRQFFVSQRDNASDQLFVSPPVIGRVSGVVRVPMSLRITRPDGSFAGVVVMSVGPEDFTDFYSRADLGGRGMLELIGLDGVVRSRKVGPQSSLEGRSGSLITLERLKEADDGGFIDDGKALDNVARIASYRRLEHYPLAVVVATAYDDELAPFHQRRTNYLIVAACSSVVILCFAGVLVLLVNRRRKEARLLQESEALYRATFNQAATGIAHVTPEGRILRANQKLYEMLGYGPEELAGCSLFDLSEPEHLRAAQNFMSQCLWDRDTATSAEIEKPYRRKDGSVLWVCETLGVVRALTGEVSYLVVVMQDITARKQLEARLSHDAMHDSLTGLPNRSMFHDRLNHALASARRYGRMVAVLYMDLDGFKEVNDTHGHAVGDLLLQQVATRLKESVRQEDTASRFGGDEFAVVLSTISAEGDCGIVAEKLERILSAPYYAAGLTLHVSASIGTAVYPTYGSDGRSLVLAADTAMYAAKRRRSDGPPRIARLIG